MPAFPLLAAVVQSAIAAQRAVPAGRMSRNDMAALAAIGLAVLAIAIHFGLHFVARRREQAAQRMGSVGQDPIPLFFGTRRTADERASAREARPPGDARRAPPAPPAPDDPRVDDTR